MTTSQPAGLRIAAADWPQPVTISVNGAPMPAYPGESLGAALLAGGYRTLCRRLRNGAPAGLFCLMGVCQECRVQVDGQWVLSCQVRVKAGLTVTF